MGDNTQGITLSGRTRAARNDGSLALKYFFELCAVALHLGIMLPIRIAITVIMLYIVTFSENWTLKLVCIAYAFCTYLDRETPHKGGRRNKWFRRSTFFKLIADYFPIRVVQTHELPPNKNYLLAVHPHGVWFFGCCMTLAADVSQLEERKGLKTYFTTLNSNFWLPLGREYLLAMGMVTASQESLTLLLTEKKGGNLVALTPGGAIEASFSNPRQYKIVLKKRKGFCRIAIETGASLVPSIMFGEVDCYNVYMKPPESWVTKIQLVVKNLMGVNPVIFRAPDSLFYFGLPKRTPITLVMGEPIHTVKNLNPSQNQVDDLHQLYMDKLRYLFEKEKHKYVSHAENVILEIAL